tara:strand:- start:1239 stop:1358 length:120 start_codon:yes stop_codon:yes gene_type:complete
MDQSKVFTEDDDGALMQSMDTNINESMQTSTKEISKSPE